MAGQVDYGRLKVSITVVAPRRSARSEDDRALARRAGRGDQAAFAELYERHAPGLLSFVQQYVGDRAAAEDVVQQTFLAAFRTLSGGTVVEHPRAWLYHVARNNALTVVRDRRPAALERALEDDLLDRAAAVPAQIEQREALEEVVRDIVALPAQQRAALALFEIADLSQGEIAEVLDCTPAQVKALVYQARTALAGSREARSASCLSVREKLTAAHGGAFNQRNIRHHLRQCEPCTAFRDELRHRRRAVALILPVLPAAALRDSVLGAAGAHGHTAAAGAAGVARPGHVRWVTGGTTAAAAALGLAWLAWPGPDPPRPNVQTRAPAVATAPATGATMPASESPAPARASRSSRARPLRPSTARKATARPAKAGARPADTGVRDGGGPAATPRVADPGPAPRSPAPAPGPGRRAPPATGADPAPGPATPAPSPPSASTPSPAGPTAPAATSAPAAPAAPVVPAAVVAPPESAPPCTDHSHATEQGLEHGKGHHKC